MKTTHEYRCLLISPSDVSAEREAVAQVVDQWNAQIGRALGARIELVRWETHSIPDLAASPQEVLNRQLLPGCDFGIALFWSRLGTPTPTCLSGSDEEIRRLLAAGIRVLVYFNRSPIPQEHLQSDQYARLGGLRDELERSGLVGYYDNLSHLREQVQLHLTSAVSGLLGGVGVSSSAGTVGQVLTATPPDVRVTSHASIVAQPGERPTKMLSINVANHSPVAVYVTAILIELDDESNLFAKMDSATGEYNGRRRLEPGDAFDFRLAPEHLLPAIPDPSVMKRAMVRDAVGRIYYSEEELFRRNVSSVFRGHSGEH